MNAALLACDTIRILCLKKLPYLAPCRRRRSRLRFGKLVDTLKGRNYPGHAHHSLDCRSARCVTQSKRKMVAKSCDNYVHNLRRFCRNGKTALILETNQAFELQNAYERVTAACSTPGPQCCSGTGHAFAQNATVYDAIPLAYNSAGFELFEIDIKVPFARQSKTVPASR